MRRTSQAFTRIELVAVLAALALLGLVALPLLAATRADSERAGCFNNLRQLGRGVLLWGNDHDDRPPWRTFVSQGGTQPDTGLKAALVWTELITLSNQLITPRVLACPSDPGVKIASSWGGAAGGLASTGFRNNAISYFVSYHSLPHLPRSVVTGDRDFTPSSFSTVSCSYGPNNASAVQSFGGFPTGWTNALHSSAGHLLFMDGSVSFVNSARLANILVGTEAQNDNASIHFVNPR